MLFTTVILGAEPGPMADGVNMGGILTLARISA